MTWFWRLWPHRHDRPYDPIFVTCRDWLELGKPDRELCPTCAARQRLTESATLDDS